MKALAAMLIDYGKHPGTRCRLGCGQSRPGLREPERDGSLEGEMACGHLPRSGAHKGGVYAI